MNQLSNFLFGFILILQINMINLKDELTFNKIGLNDYNKSLEVELNGNIVQNYSVLKNNYNIQGYYNLRIAEPIKYQNNPILEPEYPWEGNAIYLAGSVIFDSDNKMFKMWYQSFFIDSLKHANYFICYAYSNDGIKWIKPMSGLNEFNHSKQNNIVLKSNEVINSNLSQTLSASVIYNKNSLEKKYEIIYIDLFKGIKYKYGSSDDGLHWHIKDINLGSQDVNSVFVDTLTNNYFAFTKSIKTGIRSQEIFKSEDLINWTYTGADINASLFNYDKGQIYYFSVSKIDDLYLGVAGLYNINNNDKIEPFILFSHDLLNWIKPESNDPFLKLGLNGEYNSGMITMPSNPFLKIGNKIYCYFGAFNGLHSSLERRGVIGLATWNKNEFIGIHFNNNKKIIYSKPIKIRNSRLNFIANIEKKGKLNLSLLSPSGQVLQGYTQNDFTLVHLVKNKWQANWNANPNNKLPDSVMVVFSGNNFTLFSLEANNILSVVNLGLFRINNLLVSNNYPNPLTTFTKIKIILPISSNLRIIIYDILGRETKYNVYYGYLTSGEHIIQLNNLNLSSGVYVYKIITDVGQYVNKMIVLK